MDSELSGAVEPLDSVDLQSCGGNKHGGTSKGIVAGLLESATVSPGSTDEKRIQLRLNHKTSERQPDLVGTCCVDGIRYSVSLWENRTQSGQPILRGSLRQDIAKII